MVGARRPRGRGVQGGEASKGARCPRGRDVNWGEMSGSLPPVTENSTREKVFFCYLGENRNVLTHVCENTSESFDWLIIYINQLGTCFKIMQPITDNFTMLLLSFSKLR